MAMTDPSMDADRPISPYHPAAPAVRTRPVRNVRCIDEYYFDRMRDPIYIFYMIGILVGDPPMKTQSC